MPVRVRVLTSTTSRRIGEISYAFCSCRRMPGAFGPRAGWQKDRGRRGGEAARLSDLGARTEDARVKVGCSPSPVQSGACPFIAVCKSEALQWICLPPFQPELLRFQPRAVRRRCGRPSPALVAFLRDAHNLPWVSLCVPPSGVSVMVAMQHATPDVRAFWRVPFASPGEWKRVCAHTGASEGREREREREPGYDPSSPALPPFP